MKKAIDELEKLRELESANHKKQLADSRKELDRTKQELADEIAKPKQVIHHHHHTTVNKGRPCILF